MGSEMRNFFGGVFEQNALVRQSTLLYWVATGS